MSTPDEASISRMAWWQVLSRLPRATGRQMLAHRWISLGLLVGGLALSLGLSLVEHPWQEEHAVIAPGGALYVLAQYTSWWGKLENGLAVLLLGWLAFAIITRRLGGQASVITILWAQLVAGVFVNLGKSGLGRARPIEGNPEGFFGPTLDYAFQSFPSGHTTAAFALAATLSTLHPRWWPIAMFYAGLIGWSRIALHVHHPSDVLMGAVLGMTCGVLCGRAGREVRVAVAKLPIRSN